MGQSLRIDDAADGIATVAHCPERWRTLLEVSRIMVSHKNLSELLHDLAGQLHGLLEFRYLSLVLHDPARNVMRLHTLETPAPKLDPGTEFSMDDSPSAWVWQHQQPLIIGDAERYPRFPWSMKRFLAHNVRSICSVPLTSAHRRLGALNFGAAEVNAYNPAELEIRS